METKRRHEELGGEFGKWEGLNMGNDAGDDFGKCSLEGGKSMNWFLGDEFGNWRVSFLVFTVLWLILSCLLLS